MRHRFARIFGGSGELKGFGSMKCCAESHFTSFEGMRLFCISYQHLKAESRDTPTPRRVAFAAAPAFAFFFVGFGPVLIREISKKALAISDDAVTRYLKPGISRAR